MIAPLDRLRGYATYENAMRRIRGMTDAAERMDITFFVAANIHGRFVPVAVVRPGAEHYALELANANFYVTN